MLRSIRLFAPLLVLSLLLSGFPAFSQASVAPLGGLTPFLSGSQYPLSLKLKDLDGSWRTFSLSGFGDAAGQLGVYYTLLTGGGQNTYYTKGETVALGGEVYLVTYHQKNTIDYTTLLKNGGSDLPQAPQLIPDTVLSLSLLNLRLAGSLNDIQAFSLQAALNPPVPPAPDPKEATVSDLKQIGLAVMQYMQDYDEKLPPMKTPAVAKKALFPYVKSDSVFEQPQTHTLFQPNTSLSGRSLASFDNLTSMVVYYEAAPEADGLRAVLFLDGHVKRLSDADWQQAKTASHVPNPPPSVQDFRVY